MSGHVVTIVGKAGPWVKRFADPVVFRRYILGAIHAYGADRLLWVSPYEVRIA